VNRSFEIAAVDAAVGADSGLTGVAGEGQESAPSQSSLVGRPLRSAEVGEIISERWTASSRNDGRLRSGISTCGSTLCSNRIPSAPRPTIAAVNEPQRPQR
jgi:hypothetical protein